MDKVKWFFLLCLIFSFVILFAEDEVLLKNTKPHWQMAKFQLSWQLQTDAAEKLEPEKFLWQRSNEGHKQNAFQLFGIHQEKIAEIEKTYYTHPLIESENWNALHLENTLACLRALQNEKKSIQENSIELIVTVILSNLDSLKEFELQLVKIPIDVSAATKIIFTHEDALPSTLAVDDKIGGKELKLKKTLTYEEAFEFLISIRVSPPNISLPECLLQINSKQGLLDINEIEKKTLAESNRVCLVTANAAKIWYAKKKTDSGLITLKEIFDAINKVLGRNSKDQVFFHLEGRQLKSLSLPIEYRCFYGDQKSVKDLHQMHLSSDDMNLNLLLIDEKFVLREVQKYFYSGKTFAKPRMIYLAPIWEKLSVAGIAGAQLLVGEAYMRGFYFKKDREKAFQWYLRAAEQGDVNGLAAAGICYFSGKGVEQNRQKAYEMLKKSAEQGQALGQLALADYYSSLNTQEGKEESLKWVKKSAEQGLGYAITSLKMQGVDASNYPLLFGL